LVGARVTQLGLSDLGSEHLFYVEAVTMLPVVGFCRVEVLTEDVVWRHVGVRGARVLRHIAKSIVTQLLVSRGSRHSITSE